jgi:hypothetical protein
MGALIDNHRGRDREARLLVLSVGEESKKYDWTALPLVRD